MCVLRSLNQKMIEDDSSLQNDKLSELRKDPSNTSGEPASASVQSPGNRFRGSIACVEGFEKDLHILAKDQYPERSMGVFTSGGDAQGNEH